MSEKIQWEGDLFERKEYADFLTKVLLKEKGNFVLNIDSSWGSGKTFFLQHWYEDIKQEHPAIFFDAWKTDYSQNPFISIASSFLNTLSEYLPEKEKERKQKELYKKVGGIFSHTLPAVTKSIIKKYVGEDGIDALSSVGKDVEDALANGAEAIAKEVIKGHDNTQSNIVQFKEVIQGIITDIEEKSDKKSPLFVFIDELDRCRPSYAVELLENIKHLFNIENVIFILATDTAQLASAVKSIYGETFSAEIYLKRFFDQSYTLPSPSTLQYTEYLLLSHGYTDESHPLWFQFHYQNLGVREPLLLIAMIADIFKLELRDQNQCFFKLHALIATFPKSEKIHVFFLYYLIILHHIHGHHKFKSKIGGNITAQSSLFFNYGSENFAPQTLINLYENLYKLDQKGVGNSINITHAHVARIAENIYNQSNKQSSWTNILQKYPDLVILAGSIH